MKSFISSRLKSFSLHIIICVVAAMGISMSSCEKATTDDALHQAEVALQGGNIDLALSHCSQLADSTATDMSAAQMCRLAIIYARVSEISDDQDYMATAMRCYERAVTLDQDTDSLESYIAALDVESQSVMRVIREVAHALNTPCDYSATTSDEDEECEEHQ